MNLQERVEDTQLTLYILDTKAPYRAKLDIFERVNSGTPLARQQMRNCLFNGPATKWIAEKAAVTEEFLDATGKGLNQKTMRDREAINRFCAFKLLEIETYKGDMEDFLARALKKMNEFNQEELKGLSQVFKKSMVANYSLFGKHAFRKSLTSEKESARRSVINIALFDCCSVLFAKLDESIFEKKGSLIKNAIKELVNTKKLSEAITTSTNGSEQVKIRFTMINSSVEEVIK